jgi:hypothetical protein
MRPRTIKTFLILLISSSAWGQTTIRGTTKIETDGIISDSTNNSPNKKFEKRVNIKPINKSDYEIEIRFYKLTSLSNTRNVKIIKLKNDNWTALEYDEWNNPVKIKKYNLNAGLGLETFTLKLFNQKLISLPNQRELMGKMKKFTEVKGKQIESEINVMDGNSYTVEFKIGDSFRIYEFDNPDSYLRFYEDVEELKNYIAIKDLFEKDLTRK